MNYSDFDIFLLKTNDSGIEQWSQIFSDTSHVGFGYSLQQTNDGGYIITGKIGPDVNQSFDIILIKTDLQGNITSTFNIPTPSSNRKLEKVIDILGRETKP